MKSLKDFRVEKKQLKNIQGGCRQTNYRTKQGATGTDTWCDKNLDGEMTKDEISDYKQVTPPTSPSIIG